MSQPTSPPQKPILSLRGRLLTALLPTFSLVFTVLLFGPLEIFAGNADTLAFRLGEFLPAMLTFALGVWLLLLLPAMLFRGKPFWLYLSLIFVLAVCCYLQATVLNFDLGELDGTQVDWGSLLHAMRRNALVWIVAVIAAVLLCLLAGKVWRGLLRFAPIVLVGMQLVSLVATYAAKDFPVITDTYLDTGNLLELSDDENVVILVLDGFDNQAMARLMETGPEYLEAMDGFTYHPDTASLYGRTFPATTYLNTAVRNDYQQPNHVYMENAYQQGEFLPDIRALGYGVRLYSPIHSLAGDAAVLTGLADNVAHGSRMVDSPGVVGRLWKLSAYRYAPLALKPYFWMANHDFTDLVSRQDGDAYRIDDAGFYRRLVEEGITVQSDHKQYVFYHLGGVHPPFDMEADGQPLSPDDEGDEYRQSRAEMLIVKEFLDQMKALDIFEYSTIIVTADHGYWWGKDLELSDRTTSPIFFVKLSGEDDSEPLKISQAPLSHTDFHPTIMDAIGGDPDKYPEGIPAYAVYEDEERIREYIQNYENVIEVYGINGPVSDPESRFLMNKFNTEYQFY